MESVNRSTCPVAFVARVLFLPGKQAPVYWQLASPLEDGILIKGGHIFSNHKSLCLVPRQYSQPAVKFFVQDAA